MMNKFKKVYPFSTKVQRLLNDSKKRIVHKKIELIVDGDSHTLNLNIIYKK